MLTDCPRFGALIEDIPPSVAAQGAFRTALYLHHNAKFWLNHASYWKGRDRVQAKNCELNAAEFEAELAARLAEVDLAEVAP